MGGASVLPPTSLIKFIHLLHLNQASIKDLISDLTDANLVTEEEILGMRWLDLEKDDQRTMDI
jgi:hypothetical protein